MAEFLGRPGSGSREMFQLPIWPRQRRHGPSRQGCLFNFSFQRDRGKEGGASKVSRTPPLTPWVSAVGAQPTVELCASWVSRPTMKVKPWEAKSGAETSPMNGSWASCHHATTVTVGNVAVSPRRGLVPGRVTSVPAAILEAGAELPAWMGAGRLWGGFFFLFLSLFLIF